MNSNWRSVKFSELCDITRGASPRPIKDFMADEGMPWVKIADATQLNSRYIEATKENIKLEGVSKSKTVHPGDLILSNSATPGLPKFMKIDACIHDGWMLLRNFKGLNKRFAYWLLLQERKNLVMQGNGSVFTNLKTDILKNHIVLIPSEGEQEMIADILDDIQDNIELNHKTNLILEEIAQALFKSWFVDFDPVKAKIAAKQAGGTAEQIERAAMAAISGKTEIELDQLEAQGGANAASTGCAEAASQLQNLKTTAALFTDEMVVSELGEIPSGWEVKINSDLMDVRDGTHDSPKQSETGYPLVTSKHITTGELNIRDAYLISEEDFNNVNKRSNVEQGDILLTMIGTVGIPYLVVQPEVNFAIKNIGLFRTSEAIEVRNYFYFLLKSKGMQQYLEARMAGSTQKYLSLKTLRTIEMILPTPKVLTAFDNVVTPLLNKIFDNQKESESLMDIRDALLPRLLTGEIQLNENYEAM